MTFRRPEDFQHHTARLDDITIHYVREGSGPPLLLLHGWPGFWYDWAKVIGPLAKHFDVIVPDLRGYGESEKPPLDQIDLYHLDLAVEDQAKLLRHLDIKKAFVAGHDWSSFIVHKFIRRHRGLLDRALIINPIVPGFEGPWLSNAEESWYAQFHQHPVAVELVSSSREATRIYYKHFFDQWSFRDELLTPDELEVYVDNFVKPGNIEGGINFYRAALKGSRPTWTPLDESISDLRVTFLRSLGDIVNRSVWSDTVTRWYNNYTIEYFAESGHFQMIETPDLVIDRLRRAFLTDEVLPSHSDLSLTTHASRQY